MNWYEADLRVVPGLGFLSRLCLGAVGCHCRQASGQSPMWSMWPTRGQRLAGELKPASLQTQAKLQAQAQAQLKLVRSVRILWSADAAA